MRTYLLNLFCCLCLPFAAFSQAIDSTSSKLQEFDRPGQTLIESKDFNAGNIHLPLQLIQGRIPGAMISQGGGNNPFGLYSARLQGLATLNNQVPYWRFPVRNDQPLIVVDGMPGLPVSMVDPMQIASIKIIRDGAAAKYGIRAANGVIEISTHNEQAFGGVRYHAYLGVDRLNRAMKFVDATTYANIPGAHDWGFETDWLGEISRTAISQVHHLSLGGKLNENAQYGASLTFRDANGILKHQGFDRFQVNAFLSQKALNDRLKIYSRIFISSQDNNFSNPEAFKYANWMNPTMPIWDPNNEGEYFQPLLFKTYNAVAMMELNQSLGEDKHLLASLSADYQLFKQTSLKFDLQQYNQVLNRRSFISKSSLWGSGVFWGSRAMQTHPQQQSRFMDVSLDQKIKISKLTGSISLGHQYQRIERENMDASGGNFLTDAFGANNLGAAADFAEGLGVVGSSQSIHRLSAFYGNIDLNWKDEFMVQAGWRYEGSSRLGVNQQWGNFPFLAAQWDLSKSLNKGFFKQHAVRLYGSYGITGTLPFTDLLAQTQYGPFDKSFQDGEFQDYYEIVNQGNPNLKWEEKQSWMVGTELASVLFGNPFQLSLGLYGNRAKDIIRDVASDWRFTLWDNVAELKNMGVEIALDMTPIKGAKFEWNSSLILSSNQTMLEKYFHEPIGTSRNSREWLRVIDGVGECCGSNTPIKIEEGEPIGGIWGLVFQGVTPQGYWDFVDVDGDGRKDDVLDVANNGNGLPKLTSGWFNTFSFGNFDAQFLVRAAFGHSIYNVTHRQTGLANIVASERNILERALEGEGRRLTDQSQDNSFFLEKADYVRLENLNLGYTFPIQKIKAIKQLRAYITGQNLLTITNYSGWDPEYRLDSKGQVTAPGYELMDLYLPTRSFVLGVQLSM